jgi:flagellar biosynthetic protein FlhB
MDPAFWPMDWLHRFSTGAAVSQSQDKTEQPTERKKREARREGRVPKSQEVGAAISMVALLFSLRIIAPGVGEKIAIHTRTLFTSAGTASLDTGIGGQVLAMFVAGLLPFLAVATILGIAGGLAQVGFVLAPKAAKPKISHLSLKKGLQKFKPSVFGWELARTALKLGLLIILFWGPTTAWINRLGEPLGLADALDFAGGQVFTLAIRATILAVSIAAADYSVVRYRNNKELKMSKQEVKDEAKNTEGNPLLKQARRRRAIEMSRNRMIFDVARAHVVVTNPTHFAVALRYDAGEPAPRVLAKGTNKIAAKIKAEAYRNGVTVLENKPLARSLYRTSKVGSYVPAALFEAVATVLAVAYRRRRRQLVTA